MGTLMSPSSAFHLRIGFLPVGVERELCDIVGVVVVAPHQVLVRIVEPWVVDAGIAVDGDDLVFLAGLGGLCQALCEGVDEVVERVGLAVEHSHAAVRWLSPHRLGVPARAWREAL